MKLLFFSPFSGIWEHAALEARLAAALQKRGHEVVYVTCGGALRRHCVVMVFMRLSPEADECARNEVCRLCTARANLIRNTFGLRGPQLSDVVDAGLIDEVRDMVKDEGQTLLDLTWGGIPVGRRALYPFLCFQKMDTLEFSPALWKAYRDQLYQTALSVSAARQLIAQNGPDAVLTYCATYSVISSFLHVAQEAGVADYFFEGCGNNAHRRHRAIFGRRGINEWYMSLRSFWSKVEQEPANPDLLKEVGDHLESLFKARTVYDYSASVNLNSISLREMVGAKEGANILLATMSSYDEWFAAEEAGLLPRHISAFASQLEWLDWLLEYISERPHLHLIIRLHPREFPNRRERNGWISTHAKRLQQHLVDIPPNCFVNWPDQNLSLYDLAKDVDVVLNAWSSAGKEMGLLGLPVVEWAPDVLLYPPDERYCATDPGSYRLCIEQALKDGWQKDTLRKMFRWCALEYGTATFVAHRYGNSSVVYEKLVSFAHRILRKIGGARVDARLAQMESFDSATLEAIEDTIRNRQPLLLNQRVSSGKEEARALAAQVRRVVAILFGGAEGGKNVLKSNLLYLAASLEQEAV